MKRGFVRIVAALLVSCLLFDPATASSLRGLQAPQDPAISSCQIPQFSDQALASRPWIVRVVSPLRQGIAVWRQTHRSNPVAAPLLWLLEEFIFRDVTHLFLGHHALLVKGISIGVFALLHHDFKNDPLWWLIPRFGLSWAFDIGWGKSLLSLPSNYVFHFGWNALALLWNSGMPGSLQLPLMSLKRWKGSTQSPGQELSQWKRDALKILPGPARKEIEELAADQRVISVRDLLNTLYRIRRAAIRELKGIPRSPGSESTSEELALERMVARTELEEVRWKIRMASRLADTATQGTFLARCDSIGAALNRAQSDEQLTAVRGQIDVLFERSEHVRLWLIDIEDFAAETYPPCRRLAQQLQNELRGLSMSRIVNETKWAVLVEDFDGDSNEPGHIENLRTLSNLHGGSVSELFRMENPPLGTIPRMRLELKGHRALLDSLEKRWQQLRPRIVAANNREGHWGWEAALHELERDIRSALIAEREREPSSPPSQAMALPPSEGEIQSSLPRSFEPPPATDEQTVRQLAGSVRAIGVDGLERLLDEHVFDRLEISNYRRLPGLLAEVQEHLRITPIPQGHLLVLWNQLDSWWRIPESERSRLLQQTLGESGDFPGTLRQIESLAIFWRENVEAIGDAISWWAVLRYAQALVFSERRPRLRESFLAAAQTSVQGFFGEAARFHLPVPTDSDLHTQWIALAEQVLREAGESERVRLWEIARPAVNQQAGHESLSDVPGSEQELSSDIQSDFVIRAVEAQDEALARRAAQGSVEGLDVLRPALEERERQVKDRKERRNLNRAQAADRKEAFEVEKRRAAITMSNQNQTAIARKILKSDNPADLKKALRQFRKVGQRERLAPYLRNRQKRESVLAETRRRQELDEVKGRWGHAQSYILTAIRAEMSHHSFFGKGVDAAIARAPQGSALVYGTLGLEEVLPKLAKAKNVKEIILVDVADAPSVELMIPPTCRTKPIRTISDNRITQLDDQTLQEIHDIVWAEFKKNSGDPSEAWEASSARIATLQPRLTNHLPPGLKDGEATLVIASRLSSSLCPALLWNTIERFAALEAIAAGCKIPIEKLRFSATAARSELERAENQWSDRSAAVQNRVLLRLTDGNGVIHVTIGFHFRWIRLVAFFFQVWIWARQTWAGRPPGPEREIIPLANLFDGLGWIVRSDAARQIVHTVIPGMENMRSIFTCVSALPVAGQLSLAQSFMMTRQPAKTEVRKEREPIVIDSQDHSPFYALGGGRFANAVGGMVLIVIALTGLYWYQFRARPVPSETSVSSFSIPHMPTDNPNPAPLQSPNVTRHEPETFNLLWPVIYQGYIHSNDFYANLQHQVSWMEWDWMRGTDKPLKKHAQLNDLKTMMKNIVLIGGPESAGFVGHLRLHASYNGSIDDKTGLVAPHITGDVTCLETGENPDLYVTLANKAKELQQQANHLFDVVQHERNGSDADKVKAKSDFEIVNNLNARAQALRVLYREIHVELANYYAAVVGKPGERAGPEMANQIRLSIRAKFARQAPLAFNQAGEYEDKYLQFLVADYIATRFRAKKNAFLYRADHDMSIEVLGTAKKDLGLPDSFNPYFHERLAYARLKNANDDEIRILIFLNAFVPETIAYVENGGQGPVPRELVGESAGNLPIYRLVLNSMALLLKEGILSKDSEGYLMVTPEHKEQLLKWLRPHEPPPEVGPYDSKPAAKDIAPNKKQEASLSSPGKNRKLPANAA